LQSVDFCVIGFCSSESSLVSWAKGVRLGQQASTIDSWYAQRYQ